MSAADAERAEMLSIKQYASLPGEWYGDLVRGRPVREPRPGGWHSVLVGALSGKIDRYLEEHPIGYLLPEGGFLLQKDPPTVRGPDVAVVRAERLPDGIPRGFLELAPDLAVELVSHSTTASELQRKIMDYLDAGTALVWAVYPESRAVAVHRWNGESEMLVGNTLLTGDPVLPGFELPLEELFRKITG